MKIVHVVYSLEMGGAEVLVAQLCRLQRANGHEVAVCAYSNLGTLGEKLRAEGFLIEVLGEANFAVTMMRCMKVLTRMQPDVVHCHNPAPTIQAVLGARVAGASRLLATRHSLVAPPIDRAEEIKFNLAATLCDQVVGICDATCENLRHTPLAHRDKIVRVYNGVGPVDAAGIEDAHGKHGFTFLFVGRLAPVKSLHTQIAAVAEAVKTTPAIQLWIVGDGHMRAELEALTVKLGVEDHVTFWGERHDVAGFFHAADVFVMSSTSEGLPMSLLQAMSMGLPSLVTNVGGMAEVVKKAHGGRCVPVGDAQAMARAMVELAADARGREIFGVNARTAYAEYFTLEQMDREYMKLYRGE